MKSLLRDIINASDAIACMLPEENTPGYTARTRATEIFVTKINEAVKAIRAEIDREVEPEVRHLQLRKTHKYVGTCSDLDEWHDLGTTATILARAQTADHDIDGWSEVWTLRLDGKNYDEGTLATAIGDTFTSQGCACTHDCCGCISTYTSDPVRVMDRIWAVSVTFSRNI